MKVGDCHWWAAWHGDGATLKLGIKNFVTAYLLLCLAFAGAVGLSPLLHQWVEHAGEGSPHVHGPRGHFHHPSASASSRETQREHDDHSHPHRHSQGVVVRTERLFVHSEGSFPEVDVLVVRAWQSLWALLANGDSSESNERSSEGEHHHESLAASLTSGLIDSAEPLVEFVPPQTQSSARASVLFSRVVAFDWNSVTAPRGPPLLHG